MKWRTADPKRGDMIRVRAGTIYHYGIFVSPDRVVAFGKNPLLRRGESDADVRVIATDIETFLAGGFAEVATPSFAEKLFFPRDPVERAEARLGEGGYHILTNNCEHFATECYTGKRTCEQTDTTREFWKNFPVVDLYLYEIPEALPIRNTGCPERDAEITSCTNERVKREKTAVFRLLSYALFRTFGVREPVYHRQKTGQWTTDDFSISLSHGGGLCAVAVSRAPVGCDVEEILPRDTLPYAKRFLAGREKSLLSRDGSLSPEDFYRVHTGKEALFKRTGGAAFSPRKFDTVASCDLLNTKTLILNGTSYAVAVASSDAKKTRFFLVSEKDGALCGTPITEGDRDLCGLY